MNSYPRARSCFNAFFSKNLVLNGTGRRSWNSRSHRNQPVSGAQGSTRKVEGSGIISTSAAPCSSGMPTPPPGVNAGKTVLWDVSFSNSVLVTVTPRCSAVFTSETARVLPRNTPCWSAKENRMVFSLRDLISFRTPEKLMPPAVVGLPPLRLLPAVGVALLPVLLHPVGRADAVDRGRAGEAIGALRVEHHQRLLARLIFLDRIQKNTAVEHDAFIGRTQVFARPVGNAALRLAGPLVVDIDVESHSGEGLAALLVGVEAPVVVAAVDRPVVGRRVGLQALLAHRVLVDRRAEAGEDGVPIGAGVVHGHMPLRDRDLGVHRDDKSLREQDVGDADMRLRVADPAQRMQAHAVVGLLHPDLGPVVLAQQLADRDLGIGGPAPALPPGGRPRGLVLEEMLAPRGRRRVHSAL